MPISNDAEREAARAAEGERWLADYRGRAHQRFLHNGGSDADFERAWPAMKQRFLTDLAEANPHEDRVAQDVEALRAGGRYGGL